MTFKTLFLSAALLASATAAAQNFTYDDIARGRFAQYGLSGIRSTADGEHYTVIRNGNIVRYGYEAGEHETGERLLPVPAEGAEGSVALVRLDPATGRWQPAEPKKLRISGYQISENGRQILVSDGSAPIYRHSFTTDYYLCDESGLREIMPGIPDKRDASFSPDGNWIAFSSRNDLYLYDTQSAETRRITDDGAWNRIINGTTDWVYEEEFGFTRAYAFSPDSRRIAYLRFDESDVPLFEMMRYDETLYNHAYTFKYPKAGDANSTVQLWVFDIASCQKTLIDTGSDPTQYIPRIGWTPGGDLWYETRNRHQNEIAFYRIPQRKPDTPFAAQQCVYRERNDRYVDHDTDRSFRWLDDRRFLLKQESRTGWMHLYVGRTDKPELQPVTSGRWEVTDLVAATDNHVYYLSTETSPLRRNLYRIRYDGTDKQRLTHEEGSYSIAPSNGMKYYISTFSNVKTPNVVTVCRADGRIVRTVEQNGKLRNRIAGVKLPAKEFFTFATERGDTLNGYMIRPSDFDPSKRYPVLMTQYSGPGSQSVADRWSIDWEDVMAQYGYLIVCVDGRGTGFRGEAFKKCTYKELGRLEVEDQLSAARYLGTLPYVDPQRIGIYGWSYGGFMALGCACRGDGLFRTAIAVAPVTSWRYYDSIYTEIYNGLPQENPTGYDDNSPVKLAPLLRDDRTRLLLIHGTADDNVHFQNTAEMIRSLTRAGKEFDLMIYPDQNHSMMPDNRTHIRKRMINFLRERL